MSSALQAHKHAAWFYCRAIPDGANSSSSATPLKDSTHSNASTTSAHSSRKIPCHETLLKNMHSLIEEINAKRKQDTNMMDDYKKAIDILVCHDTGHVTHG